MSNLSNRALNKLREVVSRGTPIAGIPAPSPLPTARQLRLVSDVAADIRKAWPKVNYAAKAYLEAMETMSTMDKPYYEDSAQSVILYFLSNASTFRGEDAKRLKAELKELVASRG